MRQPNPLTFAEYSGSFHPNHLTTTLSVRVLIGLDLIT
jgi:hypothetical protein